MQKTNKQNIYSSICSWWYMSLHWWNFNDDQTLLRTRIRWDKKERTCGFGEGGKSTLYFSEGCYHTTYSLAQLRFSGQFVVQSKLWKVWHS